MISSQDGLPAALWETFARAYPTDNFDELDTNVLLDEAGVVGVAKIVRPARIEARLHAQRFFDTTHTAEVIFSLEEFPSPAQWFDQTYELRQAWFAVNGNRRYVLWWVQFSKVAPVFWNYFNAWVFDPKIPSKVNLIDRPSSTRWKQATKLVEDRLHQAGWISLTSQQARTPHPTITMIDWDHPIWDSTDEIDPVNFPRRAATLHELLFGEP